MDKIVVIGGGGHAKVVICVLKKLGYAIEGYTDNHDRGIILGIPRLGSDSSLSGLIERNQCLAAVVSIGKVDTSDTRLSLQRRFAKLGFAFPVIHSPHAVVNEEVTIRAGAVVLDGAIVNSGSTIGEACILNTGCIIDHDCVIGSNVHIAPGVTLSGGVSIGDNCTIGTGTRIIQSVKVCEGCLIGAGSTVVEDISVAGTYVGSPARMIR
ncbi:MAG: acetyltransferase [Nitrospira sp.]|nr:acetyltransferase [Nitrospira sp.]